jgi:pyruvate/2-oxoglutarate dehydrogenase complex dihydrolipoamide acyltransferase (E2) component
MSASTFDSPSSRSPAAVETTTTEVMGGSHIHRRISWSAIFGGVVLIIAVQFLLSMLGFAIGLGTVDVNAGSTPDASSIGIGAGLWWVITGIIACAFGGYVSAWLAGIEIRWDGMLHGLITWGLATLLALYLLTTAAGGLIGSGFSALGNVTSAAGSGIKDAAQPVAQATGLSPDVLQQQAQAYLKPANPDLATMSPQDAQKEIATNLATYAKGGPDAAAAKERVIAIMAAQQRISRDDAAKQFDDTQAKLQQARDQAAQTAKNAADTTASAASKTSFATFGYLLLAAIAAAAGGSAAIQRRVTVTHHYGPGGTASPSAARGAAS